MTERLIALETFDRRARSIKCLLDDDAELVLANQDRFDRMIRLELDLVQRMHVGGIGDRNEQSLAAPHQRHHPMLL